MLVTIFWMFNNYTRVTYVSDKIDVNSLCEKFVTSCPPTQTPTQKSDFRCPVPRNLVRVWYHLK